MSATKINVKPIPEPTLRRLPWYLAYVQLLEAKEEVVVSSTVIARGTGVDPSLVAKDLSYVDLRGKTRVGYEIKEMIAVLEDFLGFNRVKKAYIFGVGSLGGALISDRGLEHYGLDIVAGFDISPDVVGTTIGDIPVYHMDELASIAQDDVEIGVLTVPVDNAQLVTDRIIKEAKVKAIWNFTPFRIIVPDEIVVQNTSMYSHLAVMFQRMREQLAGK
ncbi:MAG: redox-sensing transcriptional repressor Rex [Porphyromonas sp.]|nr:redox-sensing transcriptional repressor Rex [Porphyromonas sp.]